MLSDLKKFIAGFRKREGLSVLFSTFLAKISGAVLSIVIVRLLPVKEYGNIAFAVSITSILSIFGGMGSNWSLLRFGPELQSLSAKFQMFRFAVAKGRQYTLPVIMLVIFSSFFLPFNLKDSKYYLILLSLSILTIFQYQTLESYFRIIGKNKVYAKSSLIGSLMLLAFSISLSYFFSGYGYVFAIVLAPLVTFLYFSRHIYFRRLESNNQLKKSFFAYGLYTSLGNIASQVIVLLGPIIAGYLHSSANDIALFKVATIIPFNLLTVPLMIMTTDFVYISKNSKDPVVLKNYYVQYLKTIGTLTVIPFIILLIFNNLILLALFGSNYTGSTTMSVILTVGVLFSFFFRTPLGNILSAVGKADWNVAHSVFWLIAFIPLSVFGYHAWGMLGIAASICCVFIISGFISLVMFFFYLKNIQLESSKGISS